MAKRRKEKDEEEDKPFKMPKFDEEAFLKKERRNIKTSFIAFLLGFLLAIICFGFYTLMSKNDPRWLLVLLVAIVSASFIKYVYEKLKIDMTDFTKKNWATSFAIYFFTWLLVLIILVNPPFYDDHAPFIDDAILPRYQEIGGTVKIVAKITDNVGVDLDSITLEITDPDDNITTFDDKEIEYERYQNYIVTFEYTNPNNLYGKFDYSLSAKDVNDRTRTVYADFYYDEDTIEVDPDETVDIDANDDIQIEVIPDVDYKNFRVYYTLNDGEQINVNRVDREEKDEYETRPEFEGWERDKEYEFQAFVEVIHYFKDIPAEYRFTNIVADSEIINLKTGNDSDIGDEAPPELWDWTKTADNQAENVLNYDYHDPDPNSNVKSIHLPRPYTSQAPGFVLIIFIAAIAAVFLIYRHKKKKDEQN
jgi:hypothetical protein